MTRRQIRENLYKMLFQVEFHDKESLRTQIEIYLEDLEMADEKDKRELRARPWHSLLAGSWAASP